MKILLGYLIVCLIWGIFSMYKQSCYSLKSSAQTYIKIFLLNFLLFPYCLVIAIKNKKL